MTIHVSAGSSAPMQTSKNDHFACPSQYMIWWNRSHPHQIAWYCLGPVCFLIQGHTKAVSTPRSMGQRLSFSDFELIQGSLSKVLTTVGWHLFIFSHSTWYMWKDVFERIILLRFLSRHVGMKELLQDEVYKINYANWPIPHLCPTSKGDRVPRLFSSLNSSMPLLRCSIESRNGESRPDIGLVPPSTASSWDWTKAFYCSLFYSWISRLITKGIVRWTNLRKCTLCRIVQIHLFDKECWWDAETLI